AFGLTDQDFIVRLSSRTAWAQFFAENGKRTDSNTLTAEDEYEFFQIVDKAERTPPEKTDALLVRFGLNAERVLGFMRSKEPTAELAPIMADLQARGMGSCVEIDYAIVRGLAYYTGVVFEVFDRAKNERALAGGGRYDKLLGLMSDGKVDMPALGFGMGDVVLANLLNDLPHAKEKMSAWMRAEHAADVYVIVAKEERRPEALAIVQKLRDGGARVDFPLTAVKVGKQFQTAEQLGATYAVLVGDEWPQVKLKHLASRTEEVIAPNQLPTKLAAQ
ncbi:MAG TPA: ATP phosphoribosyltransferase regulatory subunit, partial [Chthoniobacteraceae bacterium]|nr:ATP phosphoribosyltransferase regulatory subunit [Chthoniobacteraceae bacterium]